MAQFIALVEKLVVNAHEIAVVALGRVLAFELDASLTAHALDMVVVGPSPVHCAGEFCGVAGFEMQAGSPRNDDLPKRRGTSPSIVI